MGFAVGLRDTLRVRRDQVPSELAEGHSLEWVLTGHLLAVEGMTDGDMLTSILLLAPDGKTLRHAAAPRLPRSYCEAIDGSEIGPCAGSCGTAAFLGRPVYVTDIASDPLWSDYRHLALPHSLRACWSTPIRDTDGAVIGTFAIYHRAVGSPTSDEIEAIRMITDHVAQAIMSARDGQVDQRTSIEVRDRPALRIVRGDLGDADREWIDHRLQNVKQRRPQRTTYSPIFSLKNGDVWVSWTDSRESIRLGPAHAVEKMMRNILDRVDSDTKSRRQPKPPNKHDDE